MTPDAEARFWSRVRRDGAGCWLWTAAVTSAGYGHMSADGSDQLAHRISWQIHYGPIPHGLLVCHRCDCPLCCNPAHLFLGTDKDNGIDKARKGRCRSRKLNTSEVSAIKEALVLGAHPTQLAEQYRVNRSTIRRIRDGKVWSHVTAYVTA